MSEHDADVVGRSLAWWLRRAAAALVAGGASSGGFAATSVADSRILLAGVGVFASAVVMRVGVAIGDAGITGISLWPSDRRTEGTRQSNADLLRRGRMMRTGLERKWREGGLDESGDFEDEKEKVLEAILNVWARRLCKVCKGPVALAVIRDTGDKWIARRSSEGPLGDRIERDMACPHDGPLDAVLPKFAKYFRADAEVHVCGATYHVVALSDDVADLRVSDRAGEALQCSANEYESTYALLRWLEISDRATVKAVTKRRESAKGSRHRG